MRITFLGTGGGRWVMLRQLRGSGGFVLELADQKIHVDPGPGALIRAREYRVDLCNLTAVAVSHSHQDHMSDALVVIECMTKGATEKRGAFISNSRVIEGNNDHPSILDKYHRDYIKSVKVMKPGDRIRLGRVSVTATPTRHRDGDEMGFVFEGEGLRIGYTGDGEYFPGMEKHFRECDYLIMNVLRPRTDEWPGHMNALMARDFVNRARPGKAVLKHFGMKMLRGIADKEAAWIEAETGVKTVAARDGMVIRHGKLPEKRRKGLEEFLDQDGD
jgi:ribonuclease BN (tRNA processing enzyme)